jgi:hypothetical protein
LLNAYDIDPGSYTPKIDDHARFQNLWSWNSRIFPRASTALNVRLNDKVRIRIGNLTMTNHPIHLHGHEFLVTGTDGGPTPKSTRWYEVTTDVAVGQMRQIEFVADEEGDWAFHCHKSHHTMNAMGHDVPTMIGVEHRGVAKKITNLIPDYMVMGERGMADMAEMEMPTTRQHGSHDDRTRPFWLGRDGRHVLGVSRFAKNQKPGDYKDPGWYKHPPGEVAFEWTGAMPEPARFKAEAAPNGQNGQSMPRMTMPKQDVEVQIRKPSGHSGH